MTQESNGRNVIWIFGDQHRGQALGCNGDPNARTPNIDRMAAEGLNVTGAVSGFPLCCPYRGSLLSSRYPHECVPGHEYQMPPETPTIAHAFRDNGYHTAYFGKWHVDGFHEREGRAAMHIVPPERRGGFDEWCGYENNNSQWDCWVHGGEGSDAYHYRLPGYETDALTDLLIAYIQRQASARKEGAGQPFFAALSVQPPHNPYVAEEQWMREYIPGQVRLRPNVPAVPRIVRQARTELAGYYAQIANLDWNLGRVRRALSECGLADDTHIMFFSDHGDMHGSHGQFRKTVPWEESIRIPFIIGGVHPRYECQGGTSPALINHVDVAPTTLGLCGIEAPEWMRGTDFSGHRIPGRQTASEPQSAFLQNVIPTGHGNSSDCPWRGVVTQDGWKYVVLEHTPWLLFNLNDDPYEQVNLAHNSLYRKERERLQNCLVDWIAHTGDDFPLPKL